jgi:hypothetical protein
MMRIGLLLTIMLVAAESLPTSLAQSQSFQTGDPTAQAPSTLAPAPSMAVPVEAKQSEQETGTSFVGTIVKRRHAYVLKAADAEYLLYDRGQAKQYKGKRVKVTGNSDEHHGIQVKMIQLSLPM